MSWRAWRACRAALARGCAISGNCPSCNAQPPLEMTRLLRVRPIGRPLVIDACPILPCHVRKSYPDVMVVARAVGSCGGILESELGRNAQLERIAVVSAPRTRSMLAHRDRLRGCVRSAMRTGLGQPPPVIPCYPHFFRDKEPILGPQAACRLRVYQRFCR